MAGETVTRAPRRWPRWLLAAGALLVLNASVTFGNVWPTPAIRWQTRLSVELALVVLALGLAAGTRLAASATVLRALAGVWVLLVIGHYANVTAPALYGRDVNVYWDLPHVLSVASMLAGAAAAWRVALAAGTLVLLPVVVYWPARWAFGQVAGVLAHRAGRRALLVAAVAILALFAHDRRTRSKDDATWFAPPVGATYLRQAVLMARGIGGGGPATSVPQGPALSSNLARVRGADVFLIFVESYGAVSFDRPKLSRTLEAPRAEFEAAIRATRRAVVSAYVESPTFGGSSWLAHLSLLTGIEVRDADMNALVMMRPRETLVTTLARRGYRTVAAMPGLRRAWPEGAFYRFDALYDARALTYPGPIFGWWFVPDQFTLAQVDALELSRDPRPPLFVFYPTTSTHAPFGPTAPYQSDWKRVRTAEPYDEADVQQTYLQEPDWLNLEPSYAGALSYTYTVLSGYLRLRAERDLVMILVGDHQPPAAVSGEDASWEVPVHVIAGRQAVLDRLMTLGFVRGLTPVRPPLGPMHGLSRSLLDAFGEPGAPGPSAAGATSARRR